MNESVNIIGAGPAGLSCAIVLRQLGVPVKIKERQNLHDLFCRNSFTEIDDVEVVVINRRSTAILEEHLGIRFAPVRSIQAYAGNSKYNLDPSNFCLIRRGVSTESMNYELYSRAVEVGVDFDFGTVDLNRSDSDAVIATGIPMFDIDYVLQGWRVSIHGQLEDQKVIIDFHEFTKEYAYIARLQDKISCILLTRAGISREKLLKHLKTRVPELVTNGEVIDIRPFTFRMPRFLKDYTANRIGTSRGINDNLIFFGVGDSIIDGINFALRYMSSSYQSEPFLLNIVRKKRVLSLINNLKNLSCLVGKKEQFVSSFFKSQRVLKSLTNCVSSDVPPNMEIELNKLDPSEVRRNNSNKSEKYQISSHN